MLLSFSLIHWVCLPTTGPCYLSRTSHQLQNAAKLSTTPTAASWAGPYAVAVPLLCHCHGCLVSFIARRVLSWVFLLFVMSWHEMNEMITWVCQPTWGVKRGTTLTCSDSFSGEVPKVETYPLTSKSRNMVYLAPCLQILHIWHWNCPIFLPERSQRANRGASIDRVATSRTFRMSR